MKTRTCPLCQGEQFVISDFVPIHNILLGPMKMIGVYASVCLSCGFVAPTVDDAGLATMRESARRWENEVRETPSGQERGEL
jgi:hypothetical protein